MVMKEEMLSEEKLVINELEQGKEFANRLMNNLRIPSSKESNNSLISGILRSYENAIVMLSDEKKVLKRSSEIMNQSNKKRRITEEKIFETVKISVGTGEEEACLDDGYCWRKYGQKVIRGSKNPRSYYRCTHRFSQGCLAVKQVQKSDSDPLCYEIRYVGSHTCNMKKTTTTTTTTTTKFSVSLSKEEQNKVHKLHVTEQAKDTIKHLKSEDLMLNLDDLKVNKEIFRTFSFSNPVTENVSGWKCLMENLSPTITSESGITNELLSGSYVSVANSPTDDLCFSSLENILDLSNDLSWMQ